MNQFKVGDKVVRTHSTVGGMIKGRTYEVSSVCGTCFRIDEMDTSGHYWPMSRFTKKTKWWKDVKDVS